MVLKRTILCGSSVRRGRIIHNNIFAGYAQTLNAWFKADNRTYGWKLLLYKTFNLRSDNRNRLVVSLEFYGKFQMKNKEEKDNNKPLTRVFLAKITICSLKVMSLKK